VAEISELMSDAGFVDISERPCGLDHTAIIAQKPYDP
jgi:hypothetical protein